MRAIVLVGGEGTRLRPLTWRTPKALVPVQNRPLLDHLLLHLGRHGVTHVTLALTRRTEAIREAFGDGSRLGLSIDYAYEETPLGSGGAIAAIAGEWNETFIVCNGDVITSIDLSAMLEAHRERGAELSISLHEVDDPSPYGVVDMATDGRIRRFVEKPRREDAPSRLINAGTWIFQPSLLARMNPTTFNRVEDRLFPELCAEGRAVFGFHDADYWIDVGNPSALLRVNLDLAGARAVIDPSARIDPAARIIGPAVIGAGCVVEADAEVRGSVLWDGVRIEAGATVNASILASEVRVGAGATVEDSVIAHGVAVPAGARLAQQSLEPAVQTGANA
ncbi:MAG: NDP-sugar synthase [Chloroflexi bacterium]|nr:NDP-sugar synthase [Chloroflexota bacterium]MDA1239376.1 NDP-sugar synthase [Chloroflexota bacterium]MQC47540.1 NDP-sugar synthase [Chloroflexota bacterium]